MADHPTDPREPDIERRDVLLWLAVLAGPFAWALQQQVSYMTTPTACASGRHILLHLVSLAALLIVGAGAALSWTRWKAAPEGSTEKGDPKGSRIRFMALSAVTSCVFFALVVLATEVPNLVLRVCD